MSSTKSLSVPLIGINYLLDSRGPYVLNELDRIRRAELDKIMDSFSFILGETCSRK
jgi:hypothetical protein